MNVAELHKRIFQCRLTGDPIELDLRKASAKERDAVRIVLWQTGVLKLEKANFFQTHFEHRRSYARAVYTHPVSVLNDENDYFDNGPTILEKGSHLGMSYSAYNFLISHEDTQVIDFLREENYEDELSC